jgi:simple sugar transport system ATP-binding protein
LGCVPEERNGHAAVPGFTLAENALLTAYERMRLAARGLLRRGRATAYARQVITDFDVRTPGAQAAASSLSGGNLQKFIVGREVLQRPGVLVVAQPTWGVDAGAAAAIHAALLTLAAEGAAVVVISQDLDELMVLSDRLAALNGGRLSAAFPASEVSPERLGLLMGGVHGPAPEPLPAPALETADAH